MADADDRGLSAQQLLEIANLGRSAEELMTEPLIERWFADMNRTLMDALRNGTREEAAHWHDMMDCADKLRSVLDQYIRTGAIAVDKLRGPQHQLHAVSRFKFRRGA